MMYSEQYYESETTSATSLDVSYHQSSRSQVAMWYNLFTNTLNGIIKCIDGVFSSKRRGLNSQELSIFSRSKNKSISDYQLTSSCILAVDQVKRTIDEINDKLENNYKQGSDSAKKKLKLFLEQDQHNNLRLGTKQYSASSYSIDQDLSDAVQNSAQFYTYNENQSSQLNQDSNNQNLCQKSFTNPMYSKKNKTIQNQSNKIMSQENSDASLSQDNLKSQTQLIEEQKLKDSKKQWKIRSKIFNQQNLNQSRTPLKQVGDLRQVKTQNEKSFKSTNQNIYQMASFVTVPKLNQHIGDRVKVQPNDLTKKILVWNDNLQENKQRSFSTLNTPRLDTSANSTRKLNQDSVIYRSTDSNQEQQNVKQSNVYLNNLQDVIVQSIDRTGNNPYPIKKKHDSLYGRQTQTCDGKLEQERSLGIQIDFETLSKENTQCLHNFDKQLFNNYLRQSNAILKKSIEFQNLNNKENMQQQDIEYLNPATPQDQVVTLNSFNFSNSIQADNEPLLFKSGRSSPLSRKLLQFDSFKQIGQQKQQMYQQLNKLFNKKTQS